jgi:uncharacterized protein YjiS (DUF1127 family)
MHTNIDTSPRTRARKSWFAGGVISALTSLRNSLRNRIEVSALSEMTDHQLADIGLTRDDVKSALTAPLACDPAASLIKARRENIRRA